MNPAVDIDQLTNDENYVKVRCNMTRINENTGKRYTCSQIATEVIPPARGRHWCKNCKRQFYYDISTQQRYNVQTFVIAKPIEDKEQEV